MDRKLYRDPTYPTAVADLLRLYPPGVAPWAVMSGWYHVIILSTVTFAQAVIVVTFLLIQGVIGLANFRRFGHALNQKRRYGMDADTLIQLRLNIARLFLVVKQSLYCQAGRNRELRQPETARIVDRLYDSQFSHKCLFLYLGCLRLSNRSFPIFELNLYGLENRC